MTASTRTYLPDEQCCFLGHTVCVRSNSPELLDHLRTIYARFWQGPVAAERNASGENEYEPTPVITVTDDIENSGAITVCDASQRHSLRCKDLYTLDHDHYALEGAVPDPMSFVQWLLLMHVAEMATDYQLIHAGSVSWGDQGIILPAASGSGKTTLSLKLAMNGFRFLSDEVACLRADSDMVEPLARGINLSDHSRELLGLPPWPDACARGPGGSRAEWLVDIDAVVPGAHPAPARLSHIVFLQGFGETPRLEPLSQTNALFQLFRFSLTPAADAAGRIFTFAPLLARVKCFNLVVGDLDATAAVMLDMVKGNRHGGGGHTHGG